MSKRGSFINASRTSRSNRSPTTKRLTLFTPVTKSSWNPCASRSTRRPERTGRNGKYLASCPSPHPSPLPPPCGEGEEAEKRLAEWWRLRGERQKEIDASIARRADNETLYDQPYEDNKRIRVTGPFTVESLSPHRVLSTD